MTDWFREKLGYTDVPSSKAMNVCKLKKEKFFERDQHEFALKTSLLLKWFKCGAFGKSLREQ